MAENKPTENRLDLSKVNHEERKRRELHDLVTASDLNREMINSGQIEVKALEIAPGTKGIFWLLHANHLAGNPARALNAPSLGGQINGRTVGASEDYYTNQIGQLRKEDVRVQGFNNVDFRYLPQIEEKFFQNLDKFLNDPETLTRTDDEKIEFLAKIEIIQTLSHFPFDASGRTIEDFLVYLAKKLGLSLTLSQSGLRGFIGGELVEQSKKVRGQMRIAALRNMADQYLNSVPGMNEFILREAQQEVPIISETDTAMVAYRLSLFLIRKGVVTNVSENELILDIFNSLQKEQANLVNKLVDELNVISADDLGQGSWEIFQRPLNNFEEVLKRAQSQEYLNGVPNLLLVVLVPLLFAKNNLKGDPSESQLKVAINQLGETKKLADRVQEKFNQKVNFEGKQVQTVNETIVLLNNEIVTVLGKLDQIFQKKKKVRPAMVKELIVYMKRNYPNLPFSSES